MEGAVEPAAVLRRLHEEHGAALLSFASRLTHNPDLFPDIPSRASLTIAGHTHGGQVCVPGFGALTTNCDLPADRVKGLSEHHTEGHHTWLHVSAGIGTSPFAPYRFACPPEVTLLTLVGAQGSGS